MTRRNRPALAGEAADVDHGANPYIARLRPGMQPHDYTAVLQRCEAWWDGWEETDRSIRPWRSHEDRPFI